MKLNYRRVLFVSLAFFLIQMFWQCYDSIIPKILTDKFGMVQWLSGAVMALDNVLALFLLPLFGSLSDKCNAKIGRRTPFIAIGTLIACVLFVSLSFADNMQLTSISKISDTQSKETLSFLYNEDLGEISERIHDAFVSEEDFCNIEMYDSEGDLTEDYQNYVTPARQAYAWRRTVENPVPLIVFTVLLLLTLVAMSVFRSPAVALMPDVTPKPLRSKGNAVVNLLGTVAGAIVLVIGIVFGTGKTENSVMSYTVFFAVIAVLMALALCVFLLTVKERKWAGEANALNEKLDFASSKTESETTKDGKRKLSRGERFSLVLLLLSVAFWYVGYNAVTTKYSVYAGEVLGVDYNTTLLVALAVAAVCFLPVGFLSSKLGRKKMILFGVAILGFAFFIASFITSKSPAWLMNVLFGMAGIGWASINVNSFPMVVELATGSDVGKYTGLYYSASMAAQCIAPWLSGVFLEYVSMKTLFPFGTIAVAVSFVTMLFVRHGDSKPDVLRAIEEGVEGEID